MKNHLQRIFPFRYEGSRFRLEVVYKGEEYDPFIILSDDVPKAKESRKARERERSRHEDGEYEAEVSYSACLLFLLP